VLFVSMEVSAVDLGVRLVSVPTNIPRDHLVVGRLTDEQQGQVHAAVERLEQSQLYIVASSGYTTGDVRAHARPRSGWPGPSRVRTSSSFRGILYCEDRGETLAGRV